MNKKDVKVIKGHQVQIVLLAHVMYHQVLKLFKHEHKLLHMWLFQWVEVVFEGCQKFYQGSAVISCYIYYCYVKWFQLLATSVADNLSYKRSPPTGLFACCFSEELRGPSVKLLYTTYMLNSIVACSVTIFMKFS